MTTNPTGQEALIERAAGGCPFCGGTYPSDVQCIKGRDLVHPYRVTCRKCGCGTAHHGDFLTAWKAWYRRAEVLSSTPESKEQFAENANWSVPEGYVLVPREPSEAMLIAGCSIPGVSLETGRRMWSAMLSSSPNKGEG